MDRTERFYRIQQLLNQNRTVPVRRFLRELEISLATFKRDLEYMRSRLNIPIVWDREAAATASSKGAGVQELPGLWFSDSEIYALLTMQRLLEEVEPGLLGPHIAPLLERLKAAIGSGEHPAAEVQKRIRILHLAKRTMPLDAFPGRGQGPAGAQTAAHRLLHARAGRGDAARRLAAAPGVLPRELVPRCLVPPAQGHPQLCGRRDPGRGRCWTSRRTQLPSASWTRCSPPATASSPDATCSGRCCDSRAERARWVATEQWHPQQRTRFDPDGSYLLELPYSDHRELVMDILKHGPEVEVLAPDSLRAEVRDALQAALERYSA